MKLKFNIKHLMYLSFWSALILAVRDPLKASAPELVAFVVWVSGIAAVALFVGLYAVALIVNEGREKDHLVNKLCYALIADRILFLLLGIVPVHLE